MDNKILKKKVVNIYSNRFEKTQARYVLDVKRHIKDCQDSYNSWSEKKKVAEAGMNRQMQNYEKLKMLLNMEVKRLDELMKDRHKYKRGCSQ